MYGMSAFRDRGSLLTDHLKIDTIPQGAVIFISAPKDIPHAVYGGLMSHRAVYSRAVGTVVDGNFRDLDEQRRLGYKVCEELGSHIVRPADVCSRFSLAMSQPRHSTKSLGPAKYVQTQTWTDMVSC